MDALPATNPFGNRVLLTFLPGEAHGFRADQLHKQIERGTVGCLMFWCVSHLRHARAMHFDISAALGELSAHLGSKLADGKCAIAGGFFDGEIGIDETGRSVPANWALPRSCGATSCAKGR